MGEEAYINGAFLLFLVTGLLSISYWAGVSEIEEFGEDNDYFRD